MPEWLVLVLAVIAVPVVLAIGGLSVAGLAIWVSHRSKMRKLEIEEKERQAQMDRDLLGLGSDGLGAQFEALLERMNAIERRMDAVERTAPRTQAPPVTGSEGPRTEARRAVDTERA